MAEPRFSTLLAASSSVGSGALGLALPKIRFILRGAAEWRDRGEK
jgi:hypothetical protein